MITYVLVAIVLWGALKSSPPPLVPNSPMAGNSPLDQPEYTGAHVAADLGLEPDDYVTAPPKDFGGPPIGVGGQAR